MNARQAQLRMVAIELHQQDFSGEEFVAWLLRFPDDPDAVGRVVTEEARRALALAEGHYQRLSRRVAVLNPTMIAEVAFMQGATFAAAALGRETFAEDAERGEFWQRVRDLDRREFDETGKAKVTDPNEPQ